MITAQLGTLIGNFIKQAPQFEGDEALATKIGMELGIIETSFPPDGHFKDGIKLQDNSDGGIYIIYEDEDSICMSLRFHNKRCIELTLEPKKNTGNIHEQWTT